MKLYRLQSENGRARPVLGEAPLPEPGPHEVRVRIAAASLNYRDLLILDGAADGGLDGRIPLSDAAGHVDALGEGLDGWNLGDRVAASFFRNWSSGPFKTEYLPTSLGGRTTNGVLAEFITVPAASLGARAIVLSSSDEKLERARALGAADLVNYRSTPDWHEAVLALTSGEGASHILELGGRETYERSLKAVAAGGKIVQIGVLTGAGPSPNLERLQTVNADIIGVTVGSTAHFMAMNAFLVEKGLKPVIDQDFPFEAAAAAYGRLQSGAHFGKLVVSVAG